MRSRAPSSARASGSAHHRSGVRWAVVVAAVLLVTAITPAGSSAKPKSVKHPTCLQLFSRSAAQRLSGGSAAILTNFFKVPTALWAPNRHVAWRGTECVWTLTHAASDPNQDTCGGFAENFSVGYGGTLAEWRKLENLYKVSPGAPFSGTPETQTRFSLGMGSQAFAETAAQICQPPGSPAAYALFVLTRRHNVFYMSFYPATLNQIEQKAKAILKADKAFL